MSKTRPGTVDNEPPRPKEVREHRYWLFRFKNAAEKHSAARARAIKKGIDPNSVEREPLEEAPSGIKELYEDQPAFNFAGGWLTYGVKWDIDRRDPKGIGKILPLDESLWDSWHHVVQANAKELPEKIKEEVIKVDRPEFTNSEELTVQLSED